MTTTTPTIDDVNSDEQIAARLSDNPSDYSPSTHFLIRAKRDYGPDGETRTDPPITDNVIETCIRHGRVKAAQGERVRLTADVDGTTWNMIVLPEGDAGMVLTAYAPAHHTAETPEVFDE